jgi:short-chain fatty acids transporter
MGIPSPMALALGLSVLAFVLSYWLTKSPDKQGIAYMAEIAGFWKLGFWELLEFTLQMALILILGYTLALSAPIARITERITRPCNSTLKAVVFVCIASMAAAWINWGLGLIFGAILTRKVGEKAINEQLNINYPLVGAAAYSGLMIWHGGLSGSAPLSIALEGHFLTDLIGVIPVRETIFSLMNLTVTLLIFLLIPLFFAWMAKANSHQTFKIPSLKTAKPNTGNGGGIDEKKWVGIIFGSIMLGLFLIQAINEQFEQQLNLNNINFLFFGLALLMHGSLNNFGKAAEEAVKASTGILIQFPIYAGIMGMMKYSGFAAYFSEQMILLSGPASFPVYTFISAAITNIFVPSGGGQWVVQGPIICKAAVELGLSTPKAVMALAYGDQLTNMLQPFWALPLLGITQIKAHKLFPYTLKLMGLGTLIFLLGLLLF